ncbi:cytochrome P450 [Xylariaceae sp. FL0662B]|nr:cytochrome P450 [Xylariaceae sp. FL0662B]
MLDTLSRPAVLAPAVLVIGYVLYQLLRPSRLPNLPIVGAKPGEWFPLLRAKWRNTKDMKTATEIAYNQYKDQACLMPIGGSENFVLLPAKELQWLVDQSDSDIDTLEQIVESLQLDYTITDPQLVHNPTHVKLISTTLTKETGNLVPRLVDETQVCVDELWGTDTVNFREICVYEVMRRIIGQVTNRVFIGLPLCRNRDLLDLGIAYAQDIPVAATFLRFTWKPIRPLVALLVTLPNRIHTRKSYNIMRPEIVRRLKEYDARRADPETKGAEKAPDDFLQWLINQADTLGDPYFSKPDTIAGRILLLNFASIHTSSFAITHVILDLASSKQEYMDELRAEITSVLAEHGGEWNKRAVAAMTKLDSVMRESQRLNSFVTVATSRTVVNPKGVTTPSGTHLPHGTLVCAPSYPVFHDPAIYPEPFVFKPFRFAEKREAVDGESYVQRARQAFATTSPEYTAFGHGRHACPGRFFASTELKLMLAYIVMNYDFELQEKRPGNFWFGLNRVPPMQATIRARRRAV